MNTTKQITVSIGTKTYSENKSEMDAAFAALNSECPDDYQFVLSLRAKAYHYPRVQTSERCFQSAFHDAWLNATI